MTYRAKPLVRTRLVLTDAHRVTGVHTSDGAPAYYFHWNTEVVIRAPDELTRTPPWASEPPR